MSEIPYNTGFFACQFFNTLDRLVANQSEIGHHLKTPKILNFQSIFKRPFNNIYT